MKILDWLARKWMHKRWETLELNLGDGHTITMRFAGVIYVDSIYITCERTVLPL